MTDRGIEIVRARAKLYNLIDRANTKENDLDNLNNEIYEKSEELKSLEKAVRIDRAMSEFYDCSDSVKNTCRRCDKHQLERWFGLTGEETDELYKLIHTE